MTAGDAVDLEGYTFTLQSVDRVRGPNYAADRGRLWSRGAANRLSSCTRETRLRRGWPDDTEAAMDAGLIRDLYVALGELLDDVGRRCACTTSRSCAGSGWAGSGAAGGFGAARSQVPAPSRWSNLRMARSGRPIVPRGALT